MSPPEHHTYGSKCRLAPVRQPDDGDKDAAPPISAQFFYSSVIPIDDPLSSGALAGAADAKSSRGQLRPFSRGDNNAIEKAWLSFMSEHDRQIHRQARRNMSLSPLLAKESTEKLALVVRYLAAKHREKHGSDFQPQDVTLPSAEPLVGSPLPVCCTELLLDAAEELQRTFCALSRKGEYRLNQESVVQQVMAELKSLRTRSETTSSGGAPPVLESLPSLRQEGDPLPIPKHAPLLGASSSRPTDSTRSSSSTTPTSNIGPTYAPKSRERASNAMVPPAASGPPRPHPADDGISGKPFVRVGSPGPALSSLASTPHGFDRPVDDSENDEEELESFQTEEDYKAAARESEEARAAKNRGSGKGSVEVAVGLSRLHMVSLPTLQMKPIYWSPVNDVAAVTRATWFYKDTMLPIPPPVANQLEAGYRELRPWTETWNDELRCAVDVGPLGEEKVSYRLWPEEPGRKRGVSDENVEPTISSDPFCAARCFRGEAAAEGAVEPLHSKPATGSSRPTRSFASYHVIYKNEGLAFLLKPSLRPSAYYGRRPVAKIMKGITIGIPVVRGFDRGAWDALHNNKDASRVAGQPAASAATRSHESTGQGVCPGCKADKEKGQVTDLVLVAHGIGQKLAEKVESYHFTHAINAFRRAVNVELGNPEVRAVLRPGQNGIMVLPVNWRHTLSFEDGGPMREEDRAAGKVNRFGLKDIEPPTIPAVRSMISDIMFDIPFYMSRHKTKMVAALVSEANRVYRLWCRNNPGFSENGRVHLIAHSLGSAMAIDVLSTQPTTVPSLDLSLKQPQTQHFEFDTKNIFLLGSPVGFFLLLEQGILMPRRGRLKPGIDASDTVAKGVVGEAGMFGCIAVDNVYNIIAREDPVAYGLNGTIDPVYASSLKLAYVPSTGISIFKSMGDAVRGLVTGSSPTSGAAADGPAKPPAVRVPSQLELEVHDFTREEIAEKKAFLLNDNGQIDYFLRSGGGPLEIQYLNMLSAHSSYWTHQDFVRMLCMEIGRTPGKKGTLPAMRAVKATKRILPGVA